MSKQDEEFLNKINDLFNKSLEYFKREIDKKTEENIRKAVEKNKNPKFVKGLDKKQIINFIEKKLGEEVPKKFLKNLGENLFNYSMDIIQEELQNIGINIDKNDYDGLIVKKLSSNNVYKEGNSQSHMDIGGIQRDIFPHLQPEGYFEDIKTNGDLKNYFVLKIPIALKKTNLNYLGINELDSMLSEDILTWTTGVFDNRDYFEISSQRNLEPEIFLKFRDSFKLNDFFIVLKLKNQLKYESYVIRLSDVDDEKKGLRYLHNQFYYIGLKTIIETDNYENIYNLNALNFKRNLIFFGAPGTGKSFNLNKKKDELLGEYKSNYERVTFHPDYSYAHFVGTYKPVPDYDENGKEIISYKYVPGPFMRVLVEALKPDNYSKPYLLIIEEINRANVAAVFGDVFQLLDRDENEFSEFSINVSEDMKTYLKSEKGLGESYNEILINDEIKIPPNMFIWATMNSADQGVFMMDTAFKRRWDFSYIGINESENIIENVTVRLGKSNKNIKWNSLRQAINKQLLMYGINEDKLLGPFFIPPKYLPKEGNDKSNKEFIEIFSNKVIMYLFEDVAKARRDDLFAGVKNDKDYLLYSDIRKEFKERGIEIFSPFIRNTINDLEE